jgi:general secretion pathway protein K
MTFSRAHSETGPKRANERGLALLIVLWVVVAAALLVSAFNATVRSGVSLAGAEVQLAQTEALLDAGVEIAASRLLDPDEARRWLASNVPVIVPLAGANLVINVSDANGRIDLNKADNELLVRFLRQFTGSESDAGRLRDRIVQARGREDDKDDSKADAKSAKNASKKTVAANGNGFADGSTPEADGEAAGGQGAQGGAKAQITAPFVDIAQLRTFPGVTPELYAKLAPFLTVYSWDGRIGPLSAPDKVLGAIPNLTLSDIERLRASAAAGEKEQDDGLAELRRRAGSYLADNLGPAFVVTVEVARPGVRQRSRRDFVIAIGLDAGAPYRLIAKRPVVSSAPVSAVSG